MPLPRLSAKSVWPPRVPANTASQHYLGSVAAMVTVRDKEVFCILERGSSMRACNQFQLRLSSPPRLLCKSLTRRSIHQHKALFELVTLLASPKLQKRETTPVFSARSCLACLSPRKPSRQRPPLLCFLRALSVSNAQPPPWARPRPAGRSSGARR